LSAIAFVIALAFVDRFIQYGDGVGGEF